MSIINMKHTEGGLLYIHEKLPVINEVGLKEGLSPYLQNNIVFIALMKIFQKLFDSQLHHKSKSIKK